MRLGRVALSAIVLVVCAWFGLCIRQAEEITQVTNIVSSARPLTSAQRAQASSLLDAAATLNPDAEVKILRGRLALREDQPVRARALLLDTARSEPDSIEAWAWVARSAGSDRQAIRLALGTIARLEPKVPAAS